MEGRRKEEVLKLSAMDRSHTSQPALAVRGGHASRRTSNLSGRAMWVNRIGNTFWLPLVVTAHSDWGQSSLQKSIDLAQRWFVSVVGQSADPCPDASKTLCPVQHGAYMKVVQDAS